MFCYAEIPCDVVFFEEKRYYLCFRYSSELRYPLDKILYFNKDYPEMESKKDSLLAPIAGCPRGYVASWEIRNDSLFLKEFVRCPFTKIDLSYIFEKKNTKKGVFADWCSDLFRLSNYPYDNSSYWLLITNGIVERKVKRTPENTTQNFQQKNELIAYFYNRKKYVTTLKNA